MNEPASRFFDSQRLRLHYADWGNDSAPLLLLVHGGADHCRSWDTVARALGTHFHIVAPDLRGHGDSAWATGSSYSLSDYVYDLHGLVRHLGAERMTLVGHSMGGMISLMFTGSFPEIVTRLVVLDGMTMDPNRAAKPIHEAMNQWVAQLDAIAAHQERGYEKVEDAAARMRQLNPRLSVDQSMHLARHGTKRDAGGRLVWKFDRYQPARAPYRLSPQDHTALWARITCPTLLVRGDESFLPDPETNGSLQYFQNAQARRIAGAGHWLQHDKPDEVLDMLREFLSVGS